MLSAADDHVARLLAEALFQRTADHVDGLVLSAVHVEARSGGVVNTTRRESMCFADEMDINLRAGISADAADCGRICHEAFSTIASRHGYTSLFPTLEHGTGLMSALLSSANFYTVVAEVDGRVVGSGVLQEWDKLVGGHYRHRR